MLKINLICVGNLKDKPFIELCEEYKKRISRFAKINVIELKEKNNLDDIKLIKQSESDDILSRIDPQKTILLDVSSKHLSSEKFASMIQDLSLVQSEINFVIGGSYGFSDELLGKVDKKISMSQMTFPHRLARVMLLEQIYRAFTIINNVGYHK